MLLLLDVDLSAPLIVVPQHSASLAGLQLDLGYLKLRNAIAWAPAADHPGAAGATQMPEGVSCL